MNHIVEIQNLKCGGCAKTILNNLNAIEGVRAVAVDVEKSKVTFETMDGSILPTVEQKLSEIGYPPIGMKNSIVTKAKSFVSCASGKIHH